MTVLLTGGTGFIGINIAEELLDEGIDVVIYSLDSPIETAENSFEKRKGKHFIVKGDILDKESIELTIKKYNISKIIHAAAITPNIKREMKNTQKILEVNCIGTINLLEAAINNNVEKVVYLSSITVFGKTAFEDKLLLEDTSIPQPNTLYGITKYTVERIIERYRLLKNLNVIIARIGHVFGPWEHQTGSRDLLSPIFQVTRLAVLKEKVKLTRRGYISWVYSKDVSASISKILQLDSLNYDVYHIGSGEIWSVEKWCELLGKSNSNFKYEINANSGNVIFHSQIDHSPLDISRLKNDVGYKPQYDIKSSFADYNKWIKRNPMMFVKL